MVQIAVGSGVLSLFARPLLLPSERGKRSATVRVELRLRAMELPHGRPSSRVRHSRHRRRRQFNGILLFERREASVLCSLLFSLGSLVHFKIRSPVLILRIPTVHSPVRPLH